MTVACLADNCGDKYLSSSSCSSSSAATTKRPTLFVSDGTKVQVEEYMTIGHLMEECGDKYLGASVYRLDGNDIVLLPKSAMFQPRFDYRVDLFDRQDTSAKQKLPSVIPIVSIHDKDSADKKHAEIDDDSDDSDDEKDKKEKINDCDDEKDDGDKEKLKINGCDDDDVYPDNSADRYVGERCKYMRGCYQVHGVIQSIFSSTSYSDSHIIVVKPSDLTKPTAVLLIQSEPERSDSTDQINACCDKYIQVLVQNVQVGFHSVSRNSG